MIYSSKTKKYEVIKKLGEGESGITYLVESENKQFVLKELKIANLERWTIVERFKKEIEILKSIEHKGIPKFIDIIEDSKSLAYVQEYIEGKTFKEIIESKEKISDIDFKDYFLQALDILNYLHKMLPPIIHQDISPKNIIISNKKLYLIDFGSVKTAIIGEKTQTLTTVGTFGYMAPEQIMGKAITASDIFSLGMTFLAIKSNKKASDFELDSTTGSLDTKKLLKNIPKDLKAVIKKSVSPTLKYRFQSIDEIFSFMSFIQATKTKNKPKKIKLLLIPIVLLLMLSILYVKSLTLTDGVLKKYGNWFKGHGNLINKIAFSLAPNYSHILSNEIVDKIKISNNKKYLLSSSGEKIILWNYKTRKITTQIPTKNYPQVDFSYNDNYIYYIETNESNNSAKLIIFDILKNKTSYKLDLNKMLLNYNEDIDVKNIKCSIIQKPKNQIICVSQTYRNEKIPIYSIDIKTKKVILIKTVNGSFIEHFFYLRNFDSLIFSTSISSSNNKYNDYIYSFKTKNLKRIDSDKAISSISKKSNLIMLKTGKLYTILKDNSLKLKCDLLNEYGQDSYISDLGKIVITWKGSKLGVKPDKINIYDIKTCKLIKTIDISNKLVNKIILIGNKEILIASIIGYLELLKIGGK